MIIILIALLAALVGGIIWVRICFEEDYDIFGIIACFVVFFAAISLLIYGWTVFEYIAAGTKADIVNREFGTNYTQKEVFFGEDIIDEIRQIKRSRYEINGDLMRGAK